jgi:2-oxo-4-hydroxy-4-carboxy--5-ureidoimidazoline (OHCU) decarboxylase
MRIAPFSDSTAAAESALEDHPRLQQRLAGDFANKITRKKEEVGLDAVLNLGETEQFCGSGCHV